MGEVDLDAARAAREEARADKEPPSVVRNGRTYRLTHVLSIEAASAYRATDGALFLSLVLDNPDEVQDFIDGVTKNGKDRLPRSAALEWDDIIEIVRGAWRVDPGESSASNGSSKNGGKRSRRTSTSTTA